ncbi:class I SAM-dependent methyltransferase [Actinoplanes sichuanensis]|nr:class I SAM-dependent methyltransferase [Actinoplanes sichuanensis]
MRTDEHWANYNSRQAARPIRESCQRVLALAGPGAGRTAVDLGCGAGRETRAFLDAGWRVLALDGEPGTEARLLRTIGGRHAALTIKTSRFQDLYDLPPADLVHAGYSLPFQTRAEFDRVWTLIRSVLRPGGRVAVDLFGDRDSWAGDPNLTFLTEPEVRALFDGLTIERWEVEDEPGRAFSGPKHWHVFHVVAQRR